MSEVATAPAEAVDEPEVQTATNTLKIEYRRPWFYPKQLAAIFAPERFSAIEASTKSGKTVGALAWLIEQAMMGGGNGKNYWWVAPVSGQADIAFTRLMQFLPRGTYTANRTLKTVVLLNGAIMWFKGGDRPDSLYGDDVHAAVLDEASRLKETAWHAVRSTLTFTRGPARLIGNVKGRKNWFFRFARSAEKEVELARAENRTSDRCYHRITAIDAAEFGVIDPEEVAGARRDYPEAVFNELYMAIPSEDGSNPFGIAAIAARLGPLSLAPIRCWGWDLAKKRDYTVGVGLDDFGRVVRAVRFRLDWGQTVERIIRLTDNAPALVDATGVGDPIVEQLQRSPGSKFEGYVFTGPSKQMLMEGLAAAIQTVDGIMFPEVAPQWEESPLPVPFKQELEDFEYTYTARGGVRYSAPDGINDDVVCALALAKKHLMSAPPPIVISTSVLSRLRRTH